MLEVWRIKRERERDRQRVCVCGVGVSMGRKKKWHCEIIKKERVCCVCVGAIIACMAEAE